MGFISLDETDSSVPRGSCATLYPDLRALLGAHWLKEINAQGLDDWRIVILSPKLLASFKLSSMQNQSVERLKKRVLSNDGKAYVSWKSTFKAVKTCFHRKRV